MTPNNDIVTVENLLIALDRIETWVKVVRKGLDALPEEVKRQMDDAVFGGPDALREPGAGTS